MADAGFSAEMGEIAVGLLQCCLGQGRLHMRVKRCTQRAGVGQVVIIGCEHLADVRPQPVERALHPCVAFVCPVTQCDHRLGRPLAVVGDFLQRLLRDGADLCIGVCGQCCQRFEMPCVEQKLAHRGDRKVAVWLFDQ